MAEKTTGTARVHRFHNYVALSLPGKGETVYMSADEALQMGNALIRFAFDVNACGFTHSTMLARAIELNGTTR